MGCCGVSFGGLPTCSGAGHRASAAAPCVPESAAAGAVRYAERLRKLDRAVAASHLSRRRAPGLRGRIMCPRGCRRQCGPQVEKEKTKHGPISASAPARSPRCSRPPHRMSMVPHAACLWRRRLPPRRPAFHAAPMPLRAASCCGLGGCDEGCKGGAEALGFLEMSSGTQRKYYMLGGKGGVGKMSCTASLAVRFTNNRHPTLIISTDAAHSLSDSFAQDLSGGTYR